MGKQKLFAEINNKKIRYAVFELKDEKDAEITAMHQEIHDLKEKNKEQVVLLNKQQQQFTDLSAKVEQLLKK